MRCPVCSNELRYITYKSVGLDICTNCNGIWLSNGDIADYARALIDSGKIKGQKIELFKSRDVDWTSQEYKMCPRCNLAMKTFNYAADSNVFLDKCPQCGGIWADSAEAVQIASYLIEDPRAIMIGNSIVKQHQQLQKIKDVGGVVNEVNKHGIWILFLPKIIVPLGDDAPRLRFPLVTTMIIAFCTIIFALQISFVDDVGAFFKEFGFMPYRWDFTVFTSMFLHANIFHLIGNMLFLWIFGDNVEGRFGRFGFSFFYLACGLVATVIHFFANTSLDVPSIGASGAISGVMGAYIILYPHANIRLFFIYKVMDTPAWLYLGAWIALQLLYGFITRAFDYSNVAWFAHIGGFFFGLVYVLLTKKLMQSEAE